MKERRLVRGSTQMANYLLWYIGYKINVHNVEVLENIKIIKKLNFLLYRCSYNNLHFCRTPQNENYLNNYLFLDAFLTRVLCTWGYEQSFSVAHSKYSVNIFEEDGH